MGESFRVLIARVDRPPAPAVARSERERDRCRSGPKPRPVGGLCQLRRLPPARARPDGAPRVGYHRRAARLRLSAANARPRRSSVIFARARGKRPTPFGGFPRPGAEGSRRILRHRSRHRHVVGRRSSRSSRGRTVMSTEPSPLKYMGTQSQETVNMAAAMARAVESAEGRPPQVVGRLSDEVDEEGGKLGAAADWAMSKARDAIRSVAGKA